jgi:hypothetical protein
MRRPIVMHGDLAPRRDLADFVCIHWMLKRVCRGQHPIRVIARQPRHGDAVGAPRPTQSPSEAHAGKLRWIRAVIAHSNPLLSVGRPIDDFNGARVLPHHGPNTANQAPGQRDVHCRHRFRALRFLISSFMCSSNLSSHPSVWMKRSNFTLVPLMRSMRERFETSTQLS